MNRAYWLIVAFCLGVITMGLSGCVSNTYEIKTVYTAPADNVTIESRVSGKNSTGKIAYTFQKVLLFVNAEYLKKK